MPTIRSVLLFFSLASASLLSGQELLELDLSNQCHFGGGQQDEELYAFTSGSGVMERLVDDILTSGGDLERNFTLIQTNVASVSAVVAGEKRYILWSQDFLERATELQAYASVAHEIGHHVNGHTLQPGLKPVEEAEANLFMGYVLARKNFPEQALRDFFSRDKSNVFAQDWNESMRELAWEGFQKAGISLQLSSLQYDTDPSLQRFLRAQFPFPPPPCYQELELSAGNFSGLTTLGAVAKKITKGLSAKQYPYRYLSVPDGFAVVTQIEQYQSDGAPLSGGDRWKELPVQEDFSLSLRYLTSLVYPRQAYLRVFVFLVSNQNFNATGKRIEKETAKDWFSQAVNRLPKSVSNAPFTADHTVSMLVYEFEVPEANQKPQQHCPCHLPAGDHLKKSGLESWLKR